MKPIHKMKTMLTELDWTTYLPYRPHVHVRYMDNHGSEVDKVTTLTLRLLTKIIGIGWSKLILRPLDHIDAEITHNGEKFVPIERLVERFGNGFDYYDIGNQTTMYPYGIVQQLIEWHFDVFGLGKDNLCIYMTPDGTIDKS